jgi:hypothetical protein
MAGQWQLNEYSWQRCSSHPLSPAGYKTGCSHGVRGSQDGAAKPKLSAAALAHRCSAPTHPSSCMRQQPWVGDRQLCAGAAASLHLCSKQVHGTTPNTSTSSIASQQLHLQLIVAGRRLQGWRAAAAALPHQLCSWLPGDCNKHASRLEAPVGCSMALHPCMGNHQGCNRRGILEAPGTRPVKLGASSAVHHTPAVVPCGTEGHGW